jgi:predicted RNase H-like HicB family nuclease
MNPSFTAVIKQDGGFWIGWIEELSGVNCQGASREELMANLGIALQEALAMNPGDAAFATGIGYEKLRIPL